MIRDASKPKIKLISLRTPTNKKLNNSQKFPIFPPKQTQTQKPRRAEEFPKVRYDPNSSRGRRKQSNIYKYRRTRKPKLLIPTEN